MQTTPVPPSSDPSFPSTPKSSPGRNTTQPICPDTRVRERITSQPEFRAAHLPQARAMLLQEVPYLIDLPLEDLWNSYPIGSGLDLGSIKAHLIEKTLLSDNNTWLKSDQFSGPKPAAHEAVVFRYISEIFNAVREAVPKDHQGKVMKMISAGSITPSSDRMGTHRPDAFLLADTHEGFPPQDEAPFYWRDLTCPFEYKLKGGEASDADVCQHEPTVSYECVLTIYRMIARHYGASTISCAATLVGCSPSEPPFTGPPSLSGFFVALPPLRFVPSIG